MKNILITGAGSYIGVSLENYLGKWAENYRVDSLDMRGTDWESHSFRGYDAVFHVAGLVHQPDRIISSRRLKNVRYIPLSSFSLISFGQTLHSRL